MNRRTARSAGRSSQSVIPRRDSSQRLLVAIVAASASLAAVFLLLWLKSTRERIEFEEGGTLCPEAKGGRTQITELLVVLIDSSDELAPAQQIQVINELQRAQSRLPKFGRLDVYRTASAETELVSPVLTICNPGDGSDLSEITSNPDLAKRRWEREFDSKVRKVLRDGVGGAQSSISPIFETIQAAAVRTFDLPALDQVTERRLIIVSDLLQNVPGHSHYGGVPDFDAFRHSPYYDEVHAGLQNVKVQILYLSRPRVSASQGRRHVDFWDRYFESLGATVEMVKRVSGRTSEGASGWPE
jgi:hypothetical protein